MAFDYAKTAAAILEKVGGARNVTGATHCITRLRFVLKDGNIPKDAEIEKIPGVLRVIRQGGQYQVVIGNEVPKVFAELQKLGDFAESGASEQEKGEKESIFSKLCGFVAGAMMQLLPAMLGCGMIKVVLTLLTTFNLIDTTGSTYIILNAVGDAFFYFMPILLGGTAAKRLGSNPYLAMVVGAVLLHPDIAGLLANGNTTYFGLPVTSAAYSSSILPILLMVPILKYLEKFADKICPDVLKVFLKPLIVLFVAVPVALVAIGPIGVIAGNYLADAVNFMYGRMGWLTIMLLSALMPFIVMTGMHYALLPLCMINLATFGWDAILLTTMFCSNVAQGGASLAVAVKTKDKDVKATASAAGIAAVVAGVTEPAMYGVTLKYKTPMIAAVCASGVAGLYAGITHLVAYTMGGSPSVLTLIQMIGGEGMGNFFNGIVAVTITLVVSFGLGFVLYKPENPEVKDGAAGNVPTADDKPAPKPLVEKVEIKSPMNGDAVPLKEVSDPVFSGGILGEGIAIRPADGKVYAPADGVVSATMESRHAIGITADNGAEILIHVGLDTVKLNGEGFTMHCKMGDRVKTGDLLLECNLEFLTASGYDVITPVLVSNSAQYVTVKATGQTGVCVGDVLLTAV